MYYYLKNYFRFFFSARLKLEHNKRFQPRAFSDCPIMEANFPSEVARAVMFCHSRQCFLIFLFGNYIFKIGSKKGLNLLPSASFMCILFIVFLTFFIPCDTELLLVIIFATFSEFFHDSLKMFAQNKVNANINSTDRIGILLMTFI